MCQEFPKEKWIDAPAVKPPVLFHTLHVLVASGEQHPDCPYLVGTYLAPVSAAPVLVAPAFAVPVSAAPVEPVFP